MPTRRDFLAASAALLTSRVATGQVAAGSTPRHLGEIQNELRKLIPDLMRRYKVPGLSLALIRDREIAWVEAFGLRDKETNSPLTPETVFEAASLSKPAYSYVVLKLVELGKFSLERPLLEYLGRDLNPGEPRFKQVNARHVLSHTSGIEPQPAGEGRPPKLVFAPGERFEYSPHAFDILQLAVERAVGEKITPMMERMLLRPFGMSQSGSGWSDAFATADCKFEVANITGPAITTRANTIRPSMNRCGAFRRRSGHGYSRRIRSSPFPTPPPACMQRPATMRAS